MYKAVIRFLNEIHILKSRIYDKQTVLVAFNVLSRNTLHTLNPMFLLIIS